MGSGKPGRIKAIRATGAGVMVGSALGAVLPFAISRFFGIGRPTDVYFVVVGAAQVGAYFLGMVAETASMPILAETLAVGKGARAQVLCLARLLISRMAFLTVLVWCVVVLVVLPGSGIGLCENDNAWRFVLALCTLPIGAGLSGLAAAASYIKEKYFLTTASQGLRAAFAFAAVLLFPREQALSMAALGLSLGEFARFALLLWQLPGGGKGPYDAARMSLASSAITKLAGPAMLSSAIIAVNPLIDKAVAARVGLGAATSLELAEKIYYVPSVLIISSMSKVYTAWWARDAVSTPGRVYSDYRRVQVRAVTASLMATMAFGGLAIAALELVADYKLLPGLPGNFGVTLAVFMLGLPFALSSDLSNSIVIIFRRASVMPPVAIFLVLLNFFGDLVGANLAGLPGLAGASTLVRISSAAIMLYFAAKALKRSAA